MGYQHIDNLYKEQAILLFRECFAMEKIHGTSAHIRYKDGNVSFFSGGEKHETFKGLFDIAALQSSFAALGHPDVEVYGEAYGGKCQGMKETYGAALRFIVFEVKVGEAWLNVVNAHDVASKLALEFVHYERISTDLPAIDAQRDMDSVQAVRNGCGAGHKREGVVLRPILEFRDNRGNRIIAKHKGDGFQERKHTPVVDAGMLAILSKAESIADEWVTPMRLEHVLDKIDSPCIEKMAIILAAMVEDVEREGSGEIDWTDRKQIIKAIRSKTATLFKDRLKRSIGVQEH